MAAVILQLREFCNETSIHGFKYVADQAFSLVVRVIWFFCIIISLVYAANMIASSFQGIYFSIYSLQWYILYSCTILGWKDNPVITTIQSTAYPVEKIMFPTVTICDEGHNVYRWGMVVKLLDYLQMACQVDFVSNNNFNCSDSQKSISGLL
jgi:hypothetical protein